MWDPVKEHWLYEDLPYKSMFEDEKCVDEDQRTHLDFEARQAEPASAEPSTPSSRASAKCESTSAHQPPAKKNENPGLYTNCRISWASSPR